MSQILRALNSLSLGASSFTTLTGSADPSTITSAGNLRIGTSAAKSLIFRSNGSDRAAFNSSGDFVIDATNGGSFIMSRLTSASKTMILGASSLDADITGAFGTPGFFMTCRNSTADSFIFSDTGNNSVGPHFYCAKTRSNTTHDANTIVQDGDELGVFKGFGADGSTYRPGAGILLKVSGTPGSNDMPSKIVFQTRPAAGAIQDVLELTNSGKIKNILSSNESTGSGSAALGSNSPAVTNTAPYKWLSVVTSDGSAGFIPIWK